MDPISIIASILAVYALFTAVTAGLSVKSPEPGNPKLPTVSQSRKIPLAVGRTLVTGPNVIEATKYTGKKGSHEETRYYQNIEMAIAYGPGTLYKIFGDEKTAWDGGATPLTDDGQEIFVDAIGLFGSRRVPGEGGMHGYAMYARGDSAGYIFPGWEAKTGRDQPGYPMLSRVKFEAAALGFYWGNAPNYRPVSFEYGFFPNPLNQGNSVIGAAGSEAANPAYVLYEILKNSEYGTSSPAQVDTASIIAMGTTLYNEGLGIRRTWYTESASEIEAEILSLIDGVRYRDPLTGFVAYKLLRDDYVGIPTVTDSNIVDSTLAANSVSSVPNKISLTYLDGPTRYKEKKITESNIASRMAAGHDIQKDVEFLGAGSAAVASMLLTRETRKESKSRRSGRVVLNKVAWDWSRGDTFILSSELEGIVSMPVRILEHKKQSLEDGTVVVEFIEEVFVSGGAVFDIPDTGIEYQDVAPAVITAYQEVVIPRHLYSSGIAGYEKPAFGVLAEDPVSGSLGFYIEVNLSGFIRGSLNSFANPKTLTATTGDQDTLIDISGALYNSVLAGSEVASTYENILIFHKVGVGVEFVAYETATLNTVTGVTTLTNCHRGLYGPQPLQLDAGDLVYELEDLAITEALLTADFNNISYNLIDSTELGEALVPATPTANGHESINAPQAPAGFGVSGVPYPTGTKSGSIQVDWVTRNFEVAVSTYVFDWWNSLDQTLGVDESITLEVWDSDASELILQHPDNYTTVTSTYLYLNGHSGNIEMRAYTKDSTTGLVSPDTSISKFYYSEVEASEFYATKSGLRVMYPGTAKSRVKGMPTAPIGQSHAARNEYVLVSGKYYFEVYIYTIGTALSLPQVGVIDISLTGSLSPTWSNAALQDTAATNHSGSGNIGGITAGSRVCVAVDMATRDVWIRKNSEAWAGGGDPELGTTPYKTLTGSGQIIPYVDVGYGSEVSGLFSVGQAYTIPVGFVAWG